MKISDFRLMFLINQGAFGEVYKCVHIPSGKPYALKIISKSNLTKPSQALATFKEKEILHLLNFTDFVVNLRASF